MIARHRRAMAQQKIAQTAAQLSTIDPTSELARMEERIRLEEARAAALSEVHSAPPAWKTSSLHSKRMTISSAS